MPDCEIVEWNEDNTNLSFCPFLMEAYAAKKWAFVSDVVRLMAVYEHGGIYMDTDVLLKNSFSKYMEYDAFFFFQDYEHINTGMGFGAAKGNSLVGEMLNRYREIAFSPDNLLAIACPIINTSVVEQAFPEFHAKCENQLIRNTAFIGIEYWNDAHHFGEFSWMSEEQRYALRFAKKKHGAWAIKKIFRNPNIFYFLKQHHMGGISKVYSFLVFDFVDYGTLYWIVRLFQKFKSIFR